MSSSPGYNPSNRTQSLHSSPALANLDLELSQEPDLPAITGLNISSGFASLSLEQHSAGVIIISVILVCLIVSTIIGNSFVIIAILRDKNLQTAANLLVLSLAFADFWVGILVMPLGAYNDLNQGWFLGTQTCDFWTSADVLCCTASILNLLAIAIDRYWAVTNVDYIYKRTRQRVGLMILCAWFVAAVVSLPPILGWRDPDFESRVDVEHKCLVSQDLGYQIFATVSTFYLPLVLLLALYWRIFQVAKKRIHRKPGRNEAARSAPTTQAGSNVAGEQQQKQHLSKAKAKKSHLKASCEHDKRPSGCKDDNLKAGMINVQSGFGPRDELEISASGLMQTTAARIWLVNKSESSSFARESRHSHSNCHKDDDENNNNNKFGGRDAAGPRADEFHIKDAASGLLCNSMSKESETCFGGQEKMVRARDAWEGGRAPRGSLVSAARQTTSKTTTISRLKNVRPVKSESSGGAMIGPQDEDIDRAGDYKYDACNKLLANNCARLRNDASACQKLDTSVDISSHQQQHQHQHQHQHQRDPGACGMRHDFDMGKRLHGESGITTTKQAPPISSLLSRIVQNKKAPVASNLAVVEDGDNNDANSCTCQIGMRASAGCCCPRPVQLATKTSRPAHQNSARECRPASTDGRNELPEAGRPQTRHSPPTTPIEFEPNKCGPNDNNDTPQDEGEEEAAPARHSKKLLVYACLSGAQVNSDRLKHVPAARAPCTSCHSSLTDQKLPCCFKSNQGQHSGSARVHNFGHDSQSSRNQNSSTPAESLRAKDKSAADKLPSEIDGDGQLQPSIQYRTTFDAGTCAPSVAAAAACSRRGQKVWPEREMGELAQQSLCLGGEFENGSRGTEQLRIVSPRPFKPGPGCHHCNPRQHTPTNEAPCNFITCDENDAHRGDKLSFPAKTEVGQEDKLPPSDLKLNYSDLESVAGPVRINHAPHGLSGGGGGRGGACGVVARSPGAPKNSRAEADLEFEFKGAPSKNLASHIANVNQPNQVAACHPNAGERESVHATCHQQQQQQQSFVARTSCTLNDETDARNRCRCHRPATSNCKRVGQINDQRDESMMSESKLDDGDIYEHLNVSERHINDLNGRPDERQLFDHQNGIDGAREQHHKRHRCCHMATSHSSNSTTCSISSTSSISSSSQFSVTRTGSPFSCMDSVISMPGRDHNPQSQSAANQLASRSKSDVTISSSSESLSTAFPGPLSREIGSLSSVFAVEENTDAACNKGQQETINNQRPKVINKITTARDNNYLERAKTNDAIINRANDDNVQTSRNCSTLSDADHPGPTAPAPSLTRSSLLRRKFKALGQLVSFVQTSKAYNSSSSMPSSSSEDDEDEEAECTQVDAPDGAAGRDLGEREPEIADKFGNRITTIVPVPVPATAKTNLAGYLNRTGDTEANNLDAGDQLSCIGGDHSELHKFGRTIVCKQNVPVHNSLMAEISDRPQSTAGNLREAGKFQDAARKSSLASLVLRNTAHRVALGQIKRQAYETSNRFKEAPPTMNDVAQAGGPQVEPEVAGAGAEAAEAGTVKQKQKLIPDEESQRAAPPRRSGCVNPEALTLRQSRRANAEIKREKKAAKTLAIITGVFVCCWLPFFLNAIVMPICGESCVPSDLILSVLLWLGYLNSMLNPIIYTIFSPDFRRAFRRLLLLEK